METILQSSTAYALIFLMVDSSDGKTGKTGLTLTVTLSKNGGSFASPAGAISEIGNGWYKVAGHATDTGTLGLLVLHATGTGADPTDRTYQVVSYDPQSATSLGLSRLDAAITSRAVPGAQMDLINAPNATAITAIQAGLALASALATLQTAVSNLNGLSALAVVYGTPAMEVPSSGSIAYPFTVLVKDAEGHLLDLSGSPTITAANAAGTDRSSNLSAVTHAATGQYTFTYTVASGATQEGLSIKASGTASSDSTSRVAFASAAVVSVDTATQIAAIKTKTDQLNFTGSFVQADVQDWKGSTAPANTGDAYARLGAAGAGLTALGDARLANLDTTISSRMAAGSYSVPPTAAQIAAAVLTDTTDLGTAGSLGHLVGTAPGWYVAPATPPTTSAIAAAILLTPAQLIKTNSSNQVETSNPATVVNVTVVSS